MRPQTTHFRRTYKIKEIFSNVKRLYDPFTRAPKFLFTGATFGFGIYLIRNGVIFASGYDGYDDGSCKYIKIMDIWNFHNFLN